MVSQSTLALALLHASQGACSTEHIVIENSEGDNFVVEVSPNDPFQDVLKQISDTFALAESSSLCYVDTGYQESSGFNMNVAPSGSITISSLAKKQNATVPRAYDGALSAQDQSDIYYIIRTLANESLIKIKKEESSLKRAGDRVDHIHPLQFLTILFTNEELKVGVRNIQGRSWVGKSFIEGLTTSLGKENGVGNVMPYVNDFASKLNIDVNIILPSLQAGQWDKFVNTLIKSIPRQGNTQRYDM
jgi:hypothetical protein